MNVNYVTQSTTIAPNVTQMNVKNVKTIGSSSPNKKKYV